MSVKSGSGGITTETSLIVESFLLRLCFRHKKRIIVVMVIMTEYGDEPETLKRNIARKILKPQLPMHTEGFLAQQQQYRWGRMYILKGNEQKLIRQF